ncbi:MAG: hypothetical protein QXH30_03185 [Candidatus Bilamarchaeaceae archaeon]
MSRQQNPQAAAGQMQLPAARKDAHKRRGGGQDSPHPAFSRIESVELFYTRRVEGHYSGYDIIFDGSRLFKKTRGDEGPCQPTDAELARFVQDLQVVAAKNPMVAEFLEAYRHHASKNKQSL